MDKKINCIICGHKSDVEIVNHINTKHDGLEIYQILFPNLKVVNRELYELIDNQVRYGYCDKPELISVISGEDRKAIVAHAKRHKLVRSEIVVEVE